MSISCAMSLTPTPLPRSTIYRIDQVISIAGELIHTPASGSLVVRIETAAPLLPAPVEASGPPAPAILFRGLTQNRQYTTAAQQAELSRRSRPELAPGPSTCAVLIPIRKSPDWWRLAHDQRQAHFRTRGDQPGHTAIGLRYVDRVYCKLYHSGGLAVPYDFLTYFEFSRAHQADFNQLLRAVRDQERNPEWQYTELEIEIWMTKYQ